MSKFDVRREPVASRPMATRDFTDTDMLTHDFADSAEYRARCLERHGQYVTGGGVRVTAAPKSGRDISL